MKVTSPKKKRKPAVAIGRSMGAAEFKAHCLEVLDTVQRTHVSLTITKRGKPVARVVPVQPTTGVLFGAHRGLVTYMGDIISPIDVEWEAER
jgi:prevent-host-death family protein